MPEDPSNRLMGFLATVMKGVPEKAIQFLMLRETRALARTFVLKLATPLRARNGWEKPDS